MRVRKRPVEVDAWQIQLPLTDPHVQHAPAWVLEAIGRGTVAQSGGRLVVETREGAMTATAGAWLLRGVEGELYPCSDRIFRATYEAVA